MLLGTALFFVYGCTEEEVQPPVEGMVTDKNGPISLELTKFTATTATFSGAVNLDLYAQYDEVGIIYSLSETLEIKPLVTTVVPITNIDKNNRYEKQMEDLLYDTKYYYSSYICMNGIYKYGEVQSFTTDDVKITVSEPEVTSTTAMFKGKVELDEEDMESLSFGVAWSKEKDFEKGVVEEMSEINEDGTFAVTVSGLKMDTEYYYATCVGQIDSEYGEVKAFSTASASMIVSATQITQTSVTFEGKAELSPEDDSIEYGILYSTGDELEIGAEGCIRKKLTDTFDADGKYSLKVEGLVNDTKYNYCWYARQGDECKYGTAQEFATASASMTVSATQITQTSVTFEGQAELSPEDDSIEYGILYSTGDELEIGAEGCIRKKLTDIFDADGKYSLKVEGLVNDTKYNYCWYARQGDECKYGTAQEFATASVTINLSVDPITQTTATFKGSYEEPDGEGFEIGLIYSTSPADLTADSEAAKVIKLEDSAFSHKVDGLKYNTEYYYCTYICQDGDYKYGTAQSFKTQDVTVELSVNDITQTTATFSVKAEITESNAIEVGILYSTFNELTVDDSGVSNVVVTPLDNSAFSFKAERLQHGTTYNYCYYVCQNGKYTYSISQDFTTQSVTMNLTVDSVTQTTATFRGNVRLTEDGVIEVGVLYSIGNYLANNASGVTKQVLSPDSSGNISYEAKDLMCGSTYKYCYYFYQNGVYNYGTVYNFKTEELTWDFASAYDLSVKETANCYIVTKAGFYKIKMVKGNSETSVGAVSSAEVLWESFGTDTAPRGGELIRGVGYKDGYIGFQIPDEYVEGNAVIAARDVNGIILWSWHIWLTDQPQEHIYPNSAGTMMDRNLGATSATPGDVGTLGLLYQWGRKDPFMGARNIGDNKKQKASKSITQTYTPRTVEYSIQNPRCFIGGDINSSYDWLKSSDNDLWSSTKTIYDPCPAGWRVPDGGSYGVWETAELSERVIFSEIFSKYDGYYYLNEGECEIWYPAAGRTYYDINDIYASGEWGGYWSCTPKGNRGAYFFWFNTEDCHTKGYGSSRAGCCSIRCLKE